MILIVSSRNETPEEEVNQQLSPLLAQGYRITHAMTSIATHGDADTEHYSGLARHVYFVTTVVLEKP